MERIILVQLSDIHIGSVRNKFYSSTSLQAGLHGHDPQLLRRLAWAFASLRTKKHLAMAPGEPLYVVVSGDLTCTGLRTDFSQAYTYLLSELFPDTPGRNPVGLRIPRGQIWVVPGNHDHWDGHHRWPQPAHDPSLFPDLFDRTPWQSPPILSPKGTLRLELFGVDSNSGLAGQPYNDTAWGAFSFAELYHPQTGLDQLLRVSVATQPQGVQVVRAIVCHHPMNNKAKAGAPPPALGKLGAWPQRARERFMTRLIGQNPDPLLPSSMFEILKVARQYEVKALLTGHTHYFWEERHPLQGNPAVWEMRCSTTLQGPAQTAVQGFYVHQISLEGVPPKPVWRWKRYSYAINKFAPQAGWQVLS
jgi:hypothetical protein